MGSIEITVSAELDRWIQGLGSTDVDDASPEWKAAAEALYTRSQRYVHVITGRLQRSGRVDVRTQGREVHAEVIYDAPYAAFEHARGGEHAFLQRAYEATYDTFLRQLGKSLDNVAAQWK